MIHFKRLDHVQICIPPGSEDKARLFYTGILGLEEFPKPASLQKTGGLWYRIADIELHLGVEDNTPLSKRHPAFEVTDLAEARALLEKHGIPIKEEIEIPGRVRFSFIDPFGNRVELLQFIALAQH